MNRLRYSGPFPRVRSNSLSTLTVSAPPSSSSRQVISGPSKLPGEGPKHHGSQQHSQLALTPPNAGLQSPLFPCTPPLVPVFGIKSNPSTTSSSVSSHPSDAPRAPKRQRLKYHLDVGAYGIAKHRRHHHTQCSSSSSSSSLPHMNLSTQVGEDAYFLRENAMGIADGVGGWSRSSAPYSTHHPSPSALFSRRLMHFCSAEIDHFLETGLTDSRSIPSSGSPSPAADLVSELEDSLDELSEGIDVLQILERAYDHTVKAHVSPSSSQPLKTGSSTALLAVLDHPHVDHPNAQYPEPPLRNYAAGSCTVPPPATDDSYDPKYDAVLRIAHLGDCMGMLVRGDNIIWRSDEMWWGYNHPLQLGPPSACTGSPPQPTNPNDPLHLPVLPHTFSLPVLADDILILSSDGLSDNLWDEDILDEILKFRAQQSLSPSLSSPSHLLRRKAFAAMLSEALCSRAKRVSETRPSHSSTSSQRRSSLPKFSVIAEDSEDSPISLVTSQGGNLNRDHDLIPFARRARLASKVFEGGKQDDISVLVAVISPVPPTNNEPTHVHSFPSPPSHL